MSFLNTEISIDKKNHFIILFKIQVGWINTLANKIQTTRACHLLLCKYTNAKVSKNKSLLTQLSPLPS